MVLVLTLETTAVAEMMDVDAFGLSFFFYSAAVAAMATASSKKDYVILKRWIHSTVFLSVSSS